MRLILLLAVSLLLASWICVIAPRNRHWWLLLFIMRLGLTQFWTLRLTGLDYGLVTLLVHAIQTSGVLSADYGVGTNGTQRQQWLLIPVRLDVNMYLIGPRMVGLTGA